MRTSRRSPDSMGPTLDAGPTGDLAWISGEKGRPFVKESFGNAFAEAARFKPAVDRFFNDVLVMAPNPVVRESRLRLLRRLEDLILNLADISEIVSEDSRQT